MRRGLRLEIQRMIDAELREFRASNIYRINGEIAQLTGQIDCLKGKHSGSLIRDKDKVLCSKCYTPLGEITTTNPKEDL